MIKLKAGKYLVPVEDSYEGNRIILKFAYNPALLKEIKLFKGARWHPEQKYWSVSNEIRNIFQLEYLRGNNPYALYDAPVKSFPSQSGRSLYAHQQEMLDLIMSKRRVAIFAEMGTGKSLAMIEAMEMSGIGSMETWYIGPKGGVFAVGRELVKWGSKVHPRMYTYENVKKIMNNLGSDFVPPKFIVFDESSKIKNQTAQRTQAAMKLTDMIRETHGADCYIVLLSGSPAPKAPTDFHAQIETVCPGFFREGDVQKFRYNLALVRDEQSITGGMYPKLVTWLDDSRKCKHCGQYESAHDDPLFGHAWEASVNEVARLYKRMQGIALVKFKKDCLSLPDKIYQVINIDVPPDVMRVAKLIKDTAPRAIEALTLLRELSDGFQYVDTKTGEKICEGCHGTCEDHGAPCAGCGGTGKVATYSRETKYYGSKKEEVVADILDEIDDWGRGVIFAGFQGSVDILVNLCHKLGWAVLKLDGRGYFGSQPTGEAIDSKELLDAMDRTNPKFNELRLKYPKVVVVSHPKSGGMSLNLTASQMILYFSNSFSGEDRIQSEDRASRIGMDETRGCTIYDLIYLKTDQLVLDNLRLKRRLQDISMGEISESLES